MITLLVSGCCAETKTAPELCLVNTTLVGRVTHGDATSFDSLACVVTVTGPAELKAELTGTECRDSQLIARPVVYRETVPCPLPALDAGAFTINGLAFESDGNGGVTLPACE